MPTFNELTDDFEDGTLDTTLWSGSYGDPDEVGGRARIPCTTGFAGLKSASIYTLTSAGITVRIYPPTPSGATAAAASVLVLTSTGGTDGGFIVDPAQNAIGLYLREGYADGGAVFLTYSAVDHAWLRFRETAGTVYWDTSPDGVDWTNQRTATTPAWAAATDLAFLIEGHRDAGTADFVEVDSVNAAPFNTVTGAASLTADSTLTAAGTHTARGAATLTGDATLTAAGTRRALATTAMAADSSLAAAGTRRTVGTANLAGDSALAAAGTRTARGAAAMSASGTMTVAEAAIDYGFTTGIPSLAWEVGSPWL